MTHTLTISLPKPISLNEYYSGKHWSARSKSTKDARRKVKYLLLEQGKPLFDIDHYTIELRSNARTDIDNRIMAIKWLNDCLEKDLNWISSDSPKIFKSFSITQHDEMKLNHFVAKISFYAKSNKAFND